MTEESGELGSLIIARLCFVCVYFSFYKYDSCFVKISFTATVKEGKPETIPSSSV